MTVTTPKTLTGTWQKLAQDAGDVLMTPEADAQFVVTAADEPPIVDIAHSAPARVNTSISMDDGEYLWVTGRGLMAFTATNGV